MPLGSGAGGGGVEEEEVVVVAGEKTEVHTTTECGTRRITARSCSGRVAAAEASSVPSCGRGWIEGGDGAATRHGALGVGEPVMSLDCTSVFQRPQGQSVFLILLLFLFVQMQTPLVTRPLTATAMRKTGELPAQEAGADQQARSASLL